MRLSLYFHIRPTTPNFFFRDADVAVQFMKALGHVSFAIVGWSDGAITGLVAAGRSVVTNFSSIRTLELIIEKKFILIP